MATDPDAALHAAQPGKYKPANVDAPRAPAPTIAQDPGTLADTVEPLPKLKPVIPTAAPIEDPASLGQVFHASSTIAQQDNLGFDDKMLHDGYAPIVSALGLDTSENPALFNGEAADPAVGARTGYMGSPSRLASAAQRGVQIPFGSSWLADRADQEQLVAEAIKQRRVTDPKFLPGVPDTVDGLHKYFIEQQKKIRAGAQSTLARSPGGILATGAEFAGGTAGTFHDPTNVAALAIPGGPGKTFLQIAARDALINGVLELGQQPLVAHNRAELGETLTAGDVVSNVAGAAAGGAVLGPALHGAGKVAMATGVPQAIGRTVVGGAKATSRFVGNLDLANSRAYQLFAALPERLKQKYGAGIITKWAQRISGGDRLEDVFSELDNRELADVTSQVVGGDKLTPDEKAASNVLERGQEVGESSPFKPGPIGDGAHENNLAGAIKDLEDRLTPDGGRSTPFQSSTNVTVNGETRNLDVNVPATANAASSAAAEARPPAALSPDRRPQPSNMEFRQSPGVEAAIASFTSKVGHAENATGNIHAKNPRSSASGPAQFTDPTFRDYYKKVYGTDPGAHPAPNLKDDPAVQAKLLEALTRDNAAHLQSIGETVNDGNLYLEHFLGRGDAAKVFKANADTPVENVLSADVIERNPFLRGKSASEAIAWAHAKMGRSIASVSARPGFSSNLDAASDDPAIAQLRAEAMQLDDQVIGATKRLDGTPVNLYTSRVPASQIAVDANRFQFKAGGDEFGVTDRLQGISQWDPALSGRVMLWQDEGGRLFVADGHQRVGLAKRIGAEQHVEIPMDAMILREHDGISAEEARTLAALKNVAEGSGSAIDAAKVVRGAGLDALRRLPPKSALVRDAASLAKLSDDAFAAVYNGVIPPDYAAVIGQLLPNNPEAHGAMVDLLAKVDPANRGQAESIVRQGMAAGLHSEHQVDLFGEHELVSSLMLEKAKVLERGLAELRKMKLVHKTAAENAGTLEATGSTIAKERSAEEAQANAQAAQIVSKLAFRPGAVADALNDAARELAGGAKLAAVARDFAERIRQLDLGELDARSGADLNGDGRGGDVGEAGSAVPEEQGNPTEPSFLDEQPTLGDLEAATERFSDPDGKAVTQQADSLEHDLRAELTKAQLDRVASIMRGGTSAEVARARAIVETAPENAKIPGRGLLDLGMGEWVKELHDQGLSPAQIVDAIDIYGTVYRGDHSPEHAADVAETIKLMGLAPNAEGANGIADQFMAELRNNGFGHSYGQFEANRAQSSAEFLDHEDAGHIMEHVLDERAMKQSRILEYGKGERDLKREIKQLLKDTNNVEAAVKLVNKAIDSGRVKVNDLGEAPLTTPEPMPKSKLFPEPERTVKGAELASGKVISPEEAAARLEGWKAEAQRIGRESPPPSNYVILSLFDKSGRFSQPYRDMGYQVIQLDKAHGFDLMEDISGIQHAIDNAKANGAHFAGVLAQPPCTTFAGSGARWWDPRHNRSSLQAVSQMWGGFAAKEFSSPVEYNQYLVAVTQEYIGRADPDFFVIENPVGRIEKLTGLPKPQLAFDPSNFGDPYTKRTHLWGKFDPNLETANVDPTEGSRAHNLRGRDEKDEGLRSLTSEPFAYAFALKNRPGTEGADRAIEGGAPPPPAPTAATPELVRFASGMSRNGDLHAGAYALSESDKMGVGVEASELSSAGLDTIAHAIVDWRTDVFVDSGAFGLFRKNLRDAGSRLDLGADGKLDFDKILAKYDEIEQRISDYNAAESSDRGRLLLVMPDVVGDQAASLELLRKYQRHISTHVQFQGGGTIPIVPLQKGELSLEQAWDEAAKILGTKDFVVGIPSNEAALSTDEFKQFLEHAKPWGIHFLGAASDKTLGPKLDVLNKSGLELHHLTADANLLRSKFYGRTNELGSRPTAVMETLRKEDLALGSSSAKQFAEDSAALEARKAAKLDNGAAALPAVEKANDAAASAVGDRFGLSADEVKAILETPLNALRERDRYLAPSNTKEPTTDFEKLPLGSAKVGLYGDPDQAYVDVLRDFKPGDVKPTESGTAEDPRLRDSVQRYVEFARAGHEPPPIGVTPGRDAVPFFSQNRRRVLAAQEAGSKSIKGWLSPDNPETGLPLKYGDVRRAYEEAAAANPLDLGAAADPAIADRQRQELALKAGSPLQSTAEQQGTMGLSLFDKVDQFAMELHDEAKSLIEELDADDKAIKAMKDCL